jgi:hypothetical protein
MAKKQRRKTKMRNSDVILAYARIIKSRLKLAK